MASRPISARAVESGSAPIAVIREPDRRAGGVAAIMTGRASRPSARPSAAQLLRACLLMAIGVLCAAYIQTASAKAAVATILVEGAAAR